MLAALVGPGRVKARLSPMPALCRLLLRPAPITSKRRTVIAFVASVPGKDRQSLAFSRWPGGAVLKWL